MRKISKSRLHAEHFLTDFIRFLDDPKAIWESAYDGQLSDDAKELLVTFASLGEMTDQETLKAAFQAFSQAGKDPLNFETRFRKAIKELDGSFLTSRQTSFDRKMTFQFHNPSVKDFTDSILGQADVAREIVRRAVFHSQLTNRDSWKFVDANELVPVVLSTSNSQSQNTRRLRTVHLRQGFHLRSVFASGSNVV